MSERLHVVRDRLVIADLERRDDGRLQLTYSQRAIEAAEGRVLLSASLPVRRQPYSEPELLPFFDGLLPEATVRQRLAARLRLDPADVFGFLREIGRDCAGAYSVVPEGFDLAAGRGEGVEWLTDEELATAVFDLAARPLAVEPEKDIRISLAGAQDKMAVVIEKGRIGLPRGTTPSTHILKPASQVRGEQRHGGRLAYPALVANEAFCMTLSHVAGLQVAAVDVITIGGEPALLIDRYDRHRTNGGTIERVHQEDFCQALSVPSRLKYEKDGGPGLRQYLDLLGRNSTDYLADEPELIGRIAFNYLIGNADAHAKNFSILYAREIRLAPAYDLISTHVYQHLTHDMATSINGIFDSRAIQPVQWHKEIARLGLNQSLYAARLAELADRVEAALPEATAWLEAKSLSDRRVVEIAQLAKARIPVLRGIGKLPVRSTRGKDGEGVNAV